MCRRNAGSPLLSSLLMLLLPVFMCCLGSVHLSISLSLSLSFCPALFICLFILCQLRSTFTKQFCIVSHFTKFPQSISNSSGLALHIEYHEYLNSTFNFIFLFRTKTSFCANLMRYLNPLLKQIRHFVE